MKFALLISTFLFLTFQSYGDALSYCGEPSSDFSNMDELRDYVYSVEEYVQCATDATEELEEKIAELEYKAGSLENAVDYCESN